MYITVAQLQKLLDQQKSLCKQKFETIWRVSEFKAELKKIDPSERVMNKIYELRDPISQADYPEDFQVLKKYLIEQD